MPPRLVAYVNALSIAVLAQAVQIRELQGALTKSADILHECAKVIRQLSEVRTHSYDHLDAS